MHVIHNKYWSCADLAYINMKQHKKALRLMAQMTT